MTPEQCRSARAWLDWSQEELAKRAQVALSTIRDFEAHRRTPIGNNMAAIERVFADEGMLPEDADGEPGGVKFSPRIRERDTYLPTLRLLSEAPDGFLSTSELIAELTKHFKPTGPDADILAGRSDTRFSQIVRNVVSHKTTPTNPIHMGLMEYVRGRRGLQITAEGRRYLADAESHQHTLP